MCADCDYVHVCTCVQIVSTYMCACECVHVYMCADCECVHVATHNESDVATDYGLQEQYNQLKEQVEDPTYARIVSASSQTDLKALLLRDRCVPVEYEVVFANLAYTATGKSRRRTSLALPTKCAS
jgi:hypothetical protein